MTNIPFGSIQSILSDSVDRQRENAMRAQRAMKQKQAERSEQVEDSTDFGGVNSVDDDRQDDTGRHRQQHFQDVLEEELEHKGEAGEGESVDVVEVKGMGGETEDTPVNKTVSLPPQIKHAPSQIKPPADPNNPPTSSLDISV